MIKETIAFIGTANQQDIVLMNKFAQQNYPLLVVTDDGNQIDQLTKEVTNPSYRETIDIIECPKEGCWEADMVVLINSDRIEKSVLDKIKEVATQKIVILNCLSADRTSSLDQRKGIQDALPNSKVVQVFCDSSSDDVSVAADDKDAGLSTVSIFENLGYRAKMVG